MWFDHIHFHHPLHSPPPLGLLRPKKVSLFYSHVIYFSTPSFFCLSLNSTCERKHAIFDCPSLASFTQHDDLQVHPFSCNWPNFILLHGLIILHAHIHTYMCGHLVLFHFLAIVNKHDYAGVSTVYWHPFGYMP
jgi:hypothetical protein